MYRYLAFATSIILVAVAFALALAWPAWWWGFAVFAAIALLGTLDMLQKTSSLRRNYPILAHFRYGLEAVGPEMRQYFIEGDTTQVPFSRQQRSLVYQRSKNAMDVVPFGSQQDMYAVGYEWLNHSLAPVEIKDPDFRLVIGENAKQPYDASVLNISGMSFGALSANAVRALNLGAKLGNFYHDTGEGSISPYHRENGGDLTWQVASGYFGCRDENGHFDPEKFAMQAQSPQVKMIEIKLSQGAKPGHGGVLPAAKVTAEISVTRGVPAGQDCVSPSKHSEFSTPLGLLDFITRLRELSGGKPVGFKLAIGHPWEWFGIAKAMHESGVLPDFIVVDGGEGGTGAAPAEFIDHIGTPMLPALQLVHNTLVGLDLRDKIRIGAAGRITSGFDVARVLAMGADWCNIARGFLFSLGCIQSQSCHNDKCPTGIATQDPSRWKHLDVATKAQRVRHFHDNTLKALRDLLGAAGLNHPRELGPEHILRRVSATQIRSLAGLYPQLQPGALLGGELPEHIVFQTFWNVARADTFAPPSRIAALRMSKSA